MPIKSAPSLAVLVLNGDHQVIKLQHINKTYRTAHDELPALIDINLTVQQGEIYGVIGKSGAGKSSLIRCVNLLERPTSGSVWIENQDLTKLSAKELNKVRRQMGMVFQNFNLLSNRTVIENAGLPLELMGMRKSAIAKQIMPLLELVGLEKKYKSYPSQLSGGQKQRVAIARALATQPKILLCDEMTSSLDPETTRSILELILSINEKLNLSILLITHEMTVIKTIADRVAVLDHGRIIEEADVFTLFTQPKTAITQSFMRLTLPLELPVAIMHKIQPKPFANSCAIWRFALCGPIATKPIMSDLLKKHPIHLNILQANLEFIRQQPLGLMIVAVQGSTEEVAQAKQYLDNYGLKIEVIGYVSSDDCSIS